MDPMNTERIVVTGGTGFIGRHLLEAARGRQVHALSRRSVERAGSAGIKWTEGDLASHATWRSLLVPGSIVINLAYPAGLSDARVVDAARTMVTACAEAKVARLIHCSTVSVYGRSPGGMINELTPCNPLDDYGRRKLLIERAIREADSGECEIAILRPAAVFGDGGQNLVSLMRSLSCNQGLVRYLRASLFGRRRMHLVPVQTVVAALLFLADSRQSVAGQIFNVSDDDDSRNNYLEVERILIEALGLPERRIPVLPIPPLALKALLRVRGRSELDPYCSYCVEKLHRWGFVSPIDFDTALRTFACNWRSGLTQESA